ncbi:MAG: hypothetical protein GKR89_37290 [Candidatus Latescibacteria bacterium]|nr:hypothetical protein [Candidatus Latescibacterota bacterium]
MIEPFARVADRIRRECTDLEMVVARIERAMKAVRQEVADRDLYLDAIALNLHDFYTGIERVFHQIASTVDGNVPTGNGWHRDLLRQMGEDLPQVRPLVVSEDSIRILEEFLGFRHVVRNIYAFEFAPERIEPLVEKLRPGFELVRGQLLGFARFLDELADTDSG